MKELLFIGGEFFNYNIPKEKLFLLSYFRSPLEVQFLRYYLCFGSIDHFVEHTGYYCQRRWLLILEKRFKYMLDEQAEARTDLDLSKLASLEMGKYKIGNI